VYIGGITVNLPAEKVYRAIYNYIRAGFIERSVIADFSEPSYIEVKHGGSSLFIIKIRVVPQGSKSRVLLDSDFSGHILLWLLVLFFGCFLFCIGPVIYTISGILFSILMCWAMVMHICDQYVSRVSDLLRTVEYTGVVPEFKLEEEPKPPVDVDALHQRLIHAYSAVYGRSAKTVDREIQSYMKRGLSREEAIERMARREGLLKRAEAGPRPKPRVEEKPKLSPDILYQRLMDMYGRVYGRGRLLLEHKLEEYLKEGLSREEAIKKLAEKEGLTNT